MACGWPVFAGVGGEQPRRPQFVRITKFLRLATGQINQPCLGFHRDGRLAASPRAIIERRHGAFGYCALDAALDRLMVQSKCLAHGKKGRVFPIGQQYPRPLHPARPFAGPY